MLHIELSLKIFSVHARLLFIKKNKKINPFNILLQCFIKIKINYTWSYSHVRKDEVLCRLYNIIFAD